MTKKILVYGAAGRMGKAVCHAMHELNDRLYGGIGFNLYGEDIQGDLPAYVIKMPKVERPKLDLVISAATFNANLEIAKKCAEDNVDYCDLGGDPATSKEIQYLFKGGEASCFTDLGLAPGWINIIGEEGIQTVNQAKNVELMVGGLSQGIPVNSLKYALTWSPEGLYNEYVGLCDVLFDGMAHKVKALTKYKQHNWDGIQMESFLTKGGIGQSLPSMQKRNIKNCEYRTLRYLGHKDTLTTILEESKMGQEQFAKWIKRLCPETNKDIVYLWAKVDGWQKRFTIKADKMFTAMQKCTAFPASVVASLIFDDTIAEKGALNYHQVPIETFNERLKWLIPEF